MLRCWRSVDVWPVALILNIRRRITILLIASDLRSIRVQRAQPVLGNLQPVAAPLRHPEAGCAQPGRVGVARPDLTELLFRCGIFATHRPEQDHHKGCPRSFFCDSREIDTDNRCVPLFAGDERVAGAVPEGDRLGLGKTS